VNRPRILYSFPYTLGKPGIRTTAVHQVHELIALGLEVRVYCASSRVDLHGAASVVQTLVLAGGRVPHRVLGVRNAHHYHDRRVALAVRRLAGAVDLVHAWPRGCLRTFQAATRAGAIAVREVCNPHTESAFADAGAQARAVGVRLPRSDPHRYSARRLRQECAEYDAADFLLVPSDFVRQSFIARGYPERKLVSHQYGFSPAAFPAPGLAPPSEERPFTAAFVGRGEPRKGLHYALRAWLDSGVAEHGRFLICGAMIPAYRKSLAPLLGHPSVRELGFVDDVGAVMRRSDVLVFPSASEASALVTYEAMASGCVPLVSDATGARTRHMVDGLLHHVGDVASLTSQLRSVAEDRVLLRRLREAGMSRRDELSWPSAGQRLAQAYEVCRARHGADEQARSGQPPDDE